MTKFLPILFHVLLAACPVLIAVATHNYAAAATGTFGLLTSLLATHGVALAGIGAGVGAAVTHAKIVGAKAAALPTSTPLQAGSRAKILDLLWQDMGRNATDTEIEAFKSVRKAKVDQPSNSSSSTQPQAS